MVPGSMLASAVVSLDKEPYSHYSHLLCRWLYYSSAGQTVALYLCFGALLKNSTHVDAVFPLEQNSFKKIVKFKTALFFGSLVV